jgi:hypothetical protein
MGLLGVLASVRVLLRMSSVLCQAECKRPLPLGGLDDTDAEQPFGSSAILGSFVASVATDAASRRRRGPVALRPRLSPGVPLSRDASG